MLLSFLSWLLLIFLLFIALNTFCVSVVIEHMYNLRISLDG
jgi:hypothetical protein